MTRQTDGQATAGFLNADWSPRTLPDGTQSTAVPLRTADNAATNGFLFWRGQPDTVVCVMHPREFLATHYLIPDIVEAGCAAWSQAPRAVGNDMRLEHEAALHDVAAGLAHLKQRGFKKIVLLGNSGGASLYSFYNQQALLEPARRIETGPGGRPTKLALATMPEPDGMIYVAPHPGQGKILLTCIDPSVTDEADPLSVDSELDPLDPANGFAEPPNSSSYEPDFLQRYRAAQRARVARLDERARAMIAERLSARGRFKKGGTRADRITGVHTPVMAIWRTDADPRCFDLSLDPSERKYGSVWGRDPYASNYGAVGFARFCTPEAWLSTWSGLSSNASLDKTGPSVTQPVLFVQYTGDNTVFPEDAKTIYAALPSSDKQQATVRGDHHGRALGPGEEPGRYEVGRLVQRWLKEKFPAG